jgi:hypothetical protein
MLSYVVLVSIFPARVYHKMNKTKEAAGKRTIESDPKYVNIRNI